MSERRTRRLDVLSEAAHPAYVVWELTLACDHACRHCGSRAGAARETELSTAEALEVVAQLEAMGAREVVLIGGEAYLHEGFLEVVRALRDAGIKPSMTTGGLGITAELAREMAAAGIRLVSVSIDGLEEAHDRIRARPGSWRGAFEALGHLRAAGIATASNIHLNRVNRGDLEALYGKLQQAGIRAWQVQITAPLGRAADRPEMLLQPWDLLDLVPRLAALKRRAHADGVLMTPGNNLGYFGPEEAVLRSPTPDGADHWRGCQAGKFVMGIESDGAVKGCPSLQTAAYVGGSLKERSLDAIWAGTPELAFTRERGVEGLWGYCAECAYAEVCKGGCTFTAHSLFGRPGNNPYCYHRARVMRRRGVRERLAPADAADGRPFDCGRFEIVEEPFGAPDEVAPRERLVRLGRRPKRPEKSWY
ncbi:MAG TPA: radical SAM protein [Polyangiaceae bacterium LLY-WYZ-15_(1-7)]|nr:heme biosynthesis protein [Sandaracinus sp.]HJK92746.1 radical SAM protein [Polyangiaceae bacterium LLY-WYZ-15_(1-7)]HJL02088.1 radical SAM protein [Polyangiaceae bacterium LLY-WYZ-15_(1-7)]HJL10165.1 radical SAM protein [Polyangiaceae bacterium LLY-WYZ-15_(1-7)]HJL30444.1 radical SAM protein [Polyangiaceae bacterium LLY-WYZ-15_(1-7)]